jgi:hypothetical protein
MMSRWLLAPRVQLGNHDVSEGGGYAVEAVLNSSSGLLDVSD